MVKLIFAFLFVQFLGGCSSPTTVAEGKKEKIYVVARERESLYVFDGDRVKIINDLGNLNHATMKFKWGNGFVLARNGYLSKIDIKNDRLLKKALVGKSGIGITFTDEHIVIVNYDPGSVVVLNKNLDVVKSLVTDSRNVGVKVYKNFLIFSLMDKNEIQILDIDKNFSLVKKIENVGNLPFDALIKESNYIVGLFNEPVVGFLDLKTMSYQRIEINLGDTSTVYKVPHFGYWGLVNDYAYVPIASHKTILVIDLFTKKKVKEIALPGEPVFASISPDNKFLVVNYSGTMENSLSVIDTEKNEVVKTFEAGRRMMHLRFSNSGRHLLATSYFENELHVFDVKNWAKSGSMKVATPSGIFLNTVTE